MIETKKAAGKKTRVLLVEDHVVVRQGMAQLINQQPDLIVSAAVGDAPSALAAVAAEKPDFVVCDITLKNGNGLELLKTISAQHPGLPMLVVSMHHESLYAEVALRAGAMGYIMKEESMEKILVAIRQILAGKMYLSPDTAAKLLHQQIRGFSDTSASPVEMLSDRELQVFQMIGQWKRTREIAEDLNLSIKTIEYYREKIKEKLNLHNAVELTQYATEWVQRNAPAQAAAEKKA